MVLLGEDLWRARFACDPELVGRTVRLGDKPHTVVGIPGELVTLPILILDVDDGCSRS